MIPASELTCVPQMDGKELRGVRGFCRQPTRRHPSLSLPLRRRCGSTWLLTRWWLLWQAVARSSKVWENTNGWFVVEASWIDPDTPERYHKTIPLTPGDEREFRLVRRH
jgi:hypothetical protein